MLEEFLFWAVWAVGLLPLLTFFRSRVLDRAVLAIMSCAFLGFGALSAGIAGSSNIALGFLAGWCLIFTGVYFTLTKAISYFLKKNQRLGIIVDNRAGNEDIATPKRHKFRGSISVATLPSQNPIKK